MYKRQADEYKEFYRKVFNDYKEPLFWIHLNMDYPFNLKGILYFPKINTGLGWRLACVSKICGDVTVMVPDIASAYKSRMKVADLSSKEEIAIFERAKEDVELTGIELRNSLDAVSYTHLVKCD